MSCSACSCRSSIVRKADQESESLRETTKLTTSNWLVPETYLDNDSQVVEIQFKNTRKGFYRNSHQCALVKGDLVAVQTSQGHDIGMVSLTRRLAWVQWKRKKGEKPVNQLPIIYRKATRHDREVYRTAMSREHTVLQRSRVLISELGLSMKLSDVEFQGDNTKATFYYIAENRVDFRVLIRALAQEFRVRVEMKQIGVRQEAGMVGGIGSCGRELCCSSWKSNFQTVSMESASVQDLPTNAQKLAGQCGKLKCCLSYELNTYLEAKQDIPVKLLELETTTGTAFHQKTDSLQRIMYYSMADSHANQLIPVPVDRVREIMALNKKGIRVEQLVEKPLSVKQEAVEYLRPEESVQRFSNKKLKRKDLFRSFSSSSGKEPGKTRIG